ncbi:MAG: aminotransferase class I/II-fold pyridoxal phosphate-dependent enzyme [Desulfamplus sp.]|nr:aminotransferase class I/II-fold pyridoxal phosphate-dependent enzyme [Desulfamplus sp.]
MQIEPFKLERYFAKYEFKVKYLLSPSDCEPIKMAELLKMASFESLKLWENLKLSYTESQGHSLLRREVANLYKNISDDDLLIAAPEEAIFIAMNTLLKPDDHLIAISPAYQSLYQIAHAKGCSITNWELQLKPNSNNNLDPGTLNGTSSWSIDIDFLKQNINDKTRMIVINFPHNPTGHTLSRSEFDAIIDIARRYGIYIFSDEMYRFLEFSPSDKLPSVSDVYEKGISLSGMSKSFALPGLRIGWLATQDTNLIQKWLEFKDYTTICNSSPSEILAIMALQNKKELIRRNLEIISKNISIAEQFFQNNNDLFSWVRPKAGSVAFPKLLGDFQVEKFCKKILEDKEIMIVYGELFGFFGNHFRIGLGRENFGEIIDILDSYLKNNF